VRCLLQQPRLLIMDEPTSVLTPQAVRTLFETLRRLAGEGVSILYISHKLDEIRALCDTATVLRGGRVSGTATPRHESNDSLAQLMIGSELSPCTLTPREPGAIVLELTQLRLATPDPFGIALEDINLRVRSGEIVGIAGVSGNGQKELMAALSGETRMPFDDRGAIRIAGQPAGLLNPVQRRALGLSFVPEERLGRGAVPPMSLSDNALLTGGAVRGSQGMVRFGLVRNALTTAFASRAIAEFKVKSGGAQSAANSLSGGNLQKSIVGRETPLAPRLMIAAQPT